MYPEAMRASPDLSVVKELSIRISADRIYAQTTPKVSEKDSDQDNEYNDNKDDRKTIIVTTTTTDKTKR